MTLLSVATFTAAAIAVIAALRAWFLLREAERIRDFDAALYEGAQNERRTAARLKQEARALTEEWVA